VHLISPRPTHPPADFFLVSFWAFLGKRQREFKNTKKTYAYKKSMSKTSSEKSTTISVSGFPRFFGFIAFLGVSQRWEFKSTTKNIL
jgi:hypothetical protein